MSTLLASAIISAHIRRAAFWDRIVRDESGEGVISAAIAVLVMAFLGAGMWVAFNAVFNDASGRIESQVGSIGG